MTDTISTPRLDPNKTWFPNSLLKSPAWISLRGKAPQVFMIFMCKRSEGKGKARRKPKIYRAANYKELEFTYSEALSYGIGEHAFRRAIDALIDIGLIDVQEYGGGTECRATVYSLSNRWKKWGTDEFQAFRRIKHSRGFCSEDKRYRRDTMTDGT
jgi:hypothetical protein